MSKEQLNDYELENLYSNKDINLVQVRISLTVCIVSIIVLIITDNLVNAPAVSQIRDLMYSSIGFLTGESKKSN